MKDGDTTRQLCFVLALALLCTLSFLMQTTDTRSVSAQGETYYASKDGRNVRTISVLRAPSESRDGAVHGGGDIRFAGESALASSSGVADGSERSQTDRAGTASLYVVREADTLSEIADMFDVSVNTIIWANDIEGRSIQPGQTLVILPMTGVRHVVEEGDTLNSIAEIYDADIEEVRSFNEFDSSTELSVGDVVDIPHGEKGATITSSREVDEAPSSSPSSSSSGGSWLISPVSGVKTQHIHGYNAVDFGASMGSSVVASSGGRVIVAKAGGWNGGYGSYIIIEHSNGVQTLYAHLSTVLVGVGERVVQGEMIGYSGNSGRSTGPHLHFEVRGAVNPF